MTDHYTTSGNPYIHKTSTGEYVCDLDEIHDQIVPLVRPRISAWGSRYVLKFHTGGYEVDMIRNAGDCAVPVVATIADSFRRFGGTKPLDLESGSYIRIFGFMMNRETPIDASVIKTYTPGKIMEMMVDVVHKLHEKGIIHGDIKLSNFLICSDGRVRLCDFQSATSMEKLGAPTQWTVQWTSPYRARNEAATQRKEEDLFALGVTIWQVYTGKNPFEGLTSFQLQEALVAGETVDLNDIMDGVARRKAYELMFPMLEIGGDLTEGQG
jgi:hypothetical protein